MNTTNSASAAVSASTPLASELDIPSDKTLLHASRIAIEQDKPIMLDYYLDTKEGRAFLGEDSTTKEKMLVRSEEEYTSLIQKIFKVKDDFIVITENSLYIVSGAIKKKSITTPSS
jgi:DNA-binding GntR family transcriptional regulator